MTEESEPRDVILITVDSLRADHCGFMGYEGGTTPVLDQLAERGLVFENAVAPAVATRGSVSSFFTGSYPIDRPDLDDRTEDLRRHARARELLPERFSRMGYRTAAFTANPWTSRFFGYDQGFDDFEDFMDEDLSQSFIKGEGKNENKVVSLAVQLLNWWQGQDMFMSWEAFYDDVRAWLDEAREDDEPFFLWVFLVDAHMPYLPPKRYRSRSILQSYPANSWLFAGSDERFESLFHDTLLDSYDDTIRYTDAFMGQLVEDLGGPELDEDDPLLVFHADHGEAFGEHGDYGHGSNLYDESVHVPLLVYNGPTGRVTEPVGLYGFGDVLVDLANGDELDVDSPVARSRNFQPKRAVRGENWKYISTPDGEELYALDDDPGEFTPIDDGELVELGRRLIDDWEQADAERRRIIEATDDLVTTESV